MSNAKKYDLIVIGAGSGGIGAAGIANRLGLNVLMITSTAFDVGGDCLNYGCVPSKALIHISRLFHGGKSATDFGLEVKGKADMSKVLDYIHGQQAIINEHENPEYFRKEREMDVEIGWAKFVDKHTVRVNKRDFTAKKIVLATGSKPRTLEVPGADLVKKIHTNETIFYDLKTLPERFVIVGGGPIGCELGQAMSRLGAKVTLINRGEHIMGKERTDFQKTMEDLFRKEGITIINHASVTKFADANTVVYEKDGKEEQVKFDEILAAVGRTVRTEGMDLEKAGIEVKDGKITVDNAYRSTNKNVFVVGDAMGREQFSHGAEMHNRDLIVNMLSPFPLRRHSLEHFSWVTYTDPEVATFGWTEADLQEKGIDYTKIEQDFTHDDRAITANYHSYSKIVLYLSKKSLFNRTVKILGGTMLAPHAGELIQELLTANIEGTSVNTIFNKVYAYPVASRINQKAITQFREGDLTEGLKKIFQTLFRLW